MKSKLDASLAQLKLAVERFRDVLRQEKNEFIRDSAIQRFEFTYELAWKTMKAYAEEKGLKDLYAPKEVIRNAYQLRIIDNDPLWIRMVDVRNKTSHIYNEGMAEEVFKEIPTYLPLFEKLVKELE